MMVVRPDGLLYNDARASRNLRFNYRPAAIAYPRSQAEVAQAVTIGVGQNLKVVARSGGHSYTATSVGGRDGSFIIDLKCLTQVAVDTSSNIATIATGNRLGRVVQPLIDQNRAASHGFCLSVGIGGHVAYGGFGFPSRMWGLATDNVISMDVVLANGSSVLASKDENADLFWAMRGAGGSFGIATNIRLRVYEMPPSVTVFQYDWTLSAERTLAALVAFQDFAQTDIPSQFGVKLDFRQGPIPGTVNCSLRGGWYGASERFDGVISPFLNNMPPVTAQYVSTGDYSASIKFFGRRDRILPIDPGPPSSFYVKSLMVPENAPLSRSAIKAFVHTLAGQGHNHPSLSWLAQVELIGGPNSVVNKIPVDNTSYVYRDSLFIVQIDVTARNAAQPYPQAGYDFANSAMDSITTNMPSEWNYGAFLNFIDDRLPNWQNLYYKNHYEKLQELKARYDVNNSFGGYQTAIERPIPEHSEQMLLEKQMAVSLGKIYKYTNRLNL